MSSLFSRNAAKGTVLHGGLAWQVALILNDLQHRILKLPVVVFQNETPKVLEDTFVKPLGILCILRSTKLIWKKS